MPFVSLGVTFDLLLKFCLPFWSFFVLTLDLHLSLDRLSIVFLDGALLFLKRSLNLIFRFYLVLHLLELLRLILVHHL